MDNYVIWIRYLGQDYFESVQTDRRDVREFIKMCVRERVKSFPERFTLRGFLKNGGRYSYRKWSI